MKLALAFDTFKYIKRLKEIGFHEKQAEAQVEIMTEIYSEMINTTLATKADLRELKDDFDGLKHDLKDVENKILMSQKDLDNKLTLRMGYMLSAAVVILSGLITILHVY